MIDGPDYNEKFKETSLVLDSGSYKWILHRFSRVRRESSKFVRSRPTWWWTTQAIYLVLYQESTRSVPGMIPATIGPIIGIYCFALLFEIRSFSVMFDVVLHIKVRSQQRPYIYPTSSHTSYVIRRRSTYLIFANINFSFLLSSEWWHQ